MQAHYPIRTASGDGGSGGEWHDFVAVEEVLSAAPIGRRVVRVQLRGAESNAVPSMRQAMAFLEDEGSGPASPGKAFRACLTKSLRGIAERFAPNGYFWETPCTTGAGNGDFEFVVSENAALGAAPVDPSPFATHISRARARAADARAAVATFPNLGGDALLVVPCGEGLGAAHDATEARRQQAFAHLASFMRAAPAEVPQAQIEHMWRAVGRAMQAYFQREQASATAGRTARPVWLSTSGSGVSWLHIRLDSRPKYYQHDTYKQVC